MDNQKEKKYNILFVCLGNICRSAAAEAVMKAILKKHEDERFFVDSAGILSYHQGEPADPRMRYFAGLRGYDVTSISRPVKGYDFEKFDIIIGMDDSNVDDLKDRAGTLEQESKIHQMTEFVIHSDATCVPDPYYGGNEGFENVMDLLEETCEGLYQYLVSKI
ncbi:MAG: low molecular weight phosphotyrosine protein phosphatase [Paludibacteraceae bacterium]|nr:low molecular weight phosphotyrosine protein phosphatase [Paludibacteraceae bacterium]